MLCVKTPVTLSSMVRTTALEVDWEDVGSVEVEVGPFFCSGEPPSPSESELTPPTVYNLWSLL